MLILVVDDSESVRSTIKDMIGDAYEVLTAENGADALNIYSKTKPDVVLLDVSMPVMDGLETLPRLLKLDKNAKIIMLSALESNSIINDCLDRGAVGYLPKPCTDKELFHALSSITKSGEKYYATLFIKISNVLFRTIKKLDDTASLSLKSLVLQTMDQSPQALLPNSTLSEIKSVPKSIDDLQIKTPNGMVGYSTSFSGAENGYVISFISKQLLSQLLDNTDVDTPKEFFNVFNMKIISQFSNTYSSAIVPSLTEPLDPKIENKLTFKKIVRAQFLLSTDIFKTNVETNLCFS